MQFEVKMWSLEIDPSPT